MFAPEFACPAASFQISYTINESSQPEKFFGTSRVADFSQAALQSKEGHFAGRLDPASPVRGAGG
jgi:hypothetical protein